MLGKGSNVLVSDAGYDGAVLVLGKEFKRHAIEDEQLRTGAGVILGAVVQDAFKAGLSGLEFAVGIPGTVGGALAMNAGTRDEWIGSVVESVTLFVPGQGLVGVRGPEIAWGYRRTDLPARGIIVEAVLRVTESDAVQMRRVDGGEPSQAQAHAAARHAERRQRLREPRGRLGRSADRVGGTEGRARRRRSGLRRARELHREHRRGDSQQMSWSWCRPSATQ